MDLIAVVTVLDRARGDQPERADERLSVWRLNGQQVFGWDAPAGLGIPFVRWKTDGRLIALGTSDGVIRLLNVMNGGRMVHCLAAVPGKATTRSGLSWLAWAINFGDVKGMKGLLGQGEGNLTLDDILSLDGGRDMMAKLKPNLPRELACGIDVEASIPKLSPLPPGTGVGGSGTFGGE